MKKYSVFTGKVILSHTVTYLFAGALAYPLLTKGFYIGSNPVFASFMVTQNEPELWANVTRWIVPGQILRGILMAAALFPFFETLINWSFSKRFLSIFSLYVVFGFWASAVAAPGTIDGIVYMKPEINTYAHLMVQPEILGQGLLFALWIARWMKPAAKVVK
jgi:hypothetical protein